MSEDYQMFLSAAKHVAYQAGEVIIEAIQKPKEIENKGIFDLVTESDKKCEDIIVNSLKQQFKDHCFIGEEGSAAQGYTNALTDDPTWMIDPIDGTTNFVHGYPFVCVCIGLSINKEMVVGVVYNPILNEMFYASKGQGAYLNNAKISASAETELQKSLVATEIGSTREVETVNAVMERFRALCENTRSIRCCGSCALNMCGVACGRLDGFYEIGFGGAWDVGAATIIVREAGGVVLDPSGGEFDVMGRRVLAANSSIGPKLAAILAPCSQHPVPLET